MVRPFLPEKPRLELGAGEFKSNSDGAFAGDKAASKILLADLGGEPKLGWR